MLKRPGLYFWRNCRAGSVLTFAFVVGLWCVFCGVVVGAFAGFGFLPGLLIGTGAVWALVMFWLRCGFKAACGIEDL